MEDTNSGSAALCCFGNLRQLFRRPSPRASDFAVSFKKSSYFDSSDSLATFVSITIITSSYHVGIPNVGVGQGPGRLIEAGLLLALKRLGVIVHEVELEPVDDVEGEIGRSFELLRRTSTAVTTAIDDRSFPIVLAGNSSATVGISAGISASHLFSHNDEPFGCVWFDAHDDYNIPDTLLSGYLDSMGVSLLGDECWKALLHSVPGYRPMNLRSSFVQCGMRDVTEEQRLRVEGAGFSVVWGGSSKKGLYEKELRKTLAARHQWPTMVHVDLDCLDTSVGRANKFAFPGGLLKDDLLGCLKMVSRQTRPLSLTIGSYDPSCDPDGRMIPVAIEAVETFVKGLVASGVINV